MQEYTMSARWNTVKKVRYGWKLLIKTEQKVCPMLPNRQVECILHKN